MLLLVLNYLDAFNVSKNAKDGFENSQIKAFKASSKALNASLFRMRSPSLLSWIKEAQ
ncbi:hypothetical protein [Borreliella americana]|uniref:hypothetical protein n=1 Tax=Borreliella americana TaxID=478807 RepID=UPI001E2D0D0C|nr:hypothetical protein [Borreliella americana]MCD2382773.1 hypothetical protein [Borreliella americana]